MRLNKSEIIRRYGEGEYKRRLAQAREYKKEHREELNAADKRYREEHPEEAKAAVKKWQEEHLGEVIAYTKKWQEEHPEQVIVHNQEQNRKGGKRYDWKLEYMRAGIQGARNKIRRKHGRVYKPYKDIIAPDSQIHHEWIPKTDEYRGVALVEADAHMHGFVDVIRILDGKITLLTEEEIRKG